MSLYIYSLYSVYTITRVEFSFLGVWREMGTNVETVKS